MADAPRHVTEGVLRNLIGSELLRIGFRGGLDVELSEHSSDNGFIILRLAGYDQERSFRVHVEVLFKALKGLETTTHSELYIFLHQIEDLRPDEEDEEERTRKYDPAGRSDPDFDHWQWLVRAKRPGKLYEYFLGFPQSWFRWGIPGRLPGKTLGVCRNSHYRLIIGTDPGQQFCSCGARLYITGPYDVTKTEEDLKTYD